MLPATGTISKKAVSLAADKRAAEALLDREQLQMQIKTPLSQNEASIPELDWTLLATTEERIKFDGFRAH